MIAEDYDNTKNLNLFIRYFPFSECSNQSEYNLSQKQDILNCKKYFEADAVQNMIEQKAKTKSDGF